MIHLLRNALEDKNNTKFIFVSDTCIPIRSFNYIYDFLKNETRSFILLQREQVYPRYDFLKEVFEIENIWKHSDWIILNREHSELFTENENQIIELFSTNYKNITRKLWFPTECIYGTYLSHIGRVDEIKRMSSTCADWSKGGPNPKHFNNFNNKELDNFLLKTCFFARKIIGISQPTLEKLFDIYKSVI